VTGNTHAPCSTPGGASDLLTAMVGYDAFTQALTNPLLAPQVFTEDTFTRTGLRIIKKTRTLQEILTSNAADPSRSLVRFTYGLERRYWPRRSS
jgi:prostaglandin-endoperoxide synthase 2